MTDDMIGEAVARILRVLQPEASPDPYEIDVTTTYRRSFATGDAAGHIGAFPGRQVIHLYVRPPRELGAEPDYRILVGTFDPLMSRLTLAKGAPSEIVRVTIERLGGAFETVVSVAAAGR